MSTGLHKVRTYLLVPAFEAFYLLSPAEEVRFAIYAIILSENLPVSRRHHDWCRISGAFYNVLFPFSTVSKLAVFVDGLTIVWFLL